MPQAQTPHLRTWRGHSCLPCRDSSRHLPRLCERPCGLALLALIAIPLWAQETPKEAKVT